MSKPDSEHEVASSVRRHAERRLHWLREGDPSLTRLFARVGVLGWMIVTPMLFGLLLGHWLDRMFGAGIFWSASLLFLGLALGCWSAWKWVQKP